MNIFLEVLKEIKFIIVNFAFLDRKNKIKLSKDNDYNNFKIKFSPTFITASNHKDIIELTEKIKNFLIVMERDCKNFDSTIFLNNFKNTFFNIKNMKRDLKLGVNGSVSVSDKINYFNICTLKVIYHELFHLASSTDNKTYELFQPFNEGYTQLLAERYFNENTEKAYLFETCILKIVETILGKDILEKEYFRSNLKEAIKEISKYETPENIKDMMINFRIIFDLNKKGDISFIEKNIEIQNSLNKVINILFSCLKNKIETIEDVAKKLEILNINDWCSDIIYENQSCKREFKLLDERVFLEYINSLLSLKNIEEKNK